MSLLEYEVKLVTTDLLWHILDQKQKCDCVNAYLVAMQWSWTRLKIALRHFCLISSKLNYIDNYTNKLFTQL